MAPTEARRQAAQKIFAHEERLQAKREKTLVRPGFRERVEELMRDQWHEPVIVLRLGDADLGFDVPGRRLDPLETPDAGDELWPGTDPDLLT
ncbi:hypothetical protein AB0I53_05975 [Saccharopolyspora sp. NPDC050389]|uniref:hypothetical protein n=1 Tax=Saccharopolyspora sp. NPDC050389 TaxID=3155516 RepID=UPI0033E26DD3